MGQLVQFPSRMLFGLYGTSDICIRDCYDARVYRGGKTLMYTRIPDSPQLRAAFRGELIIPKMTPDGLELILKDQVFERASSMALASAVQIAREEKGKPHLMVFKIGSHQLPDVLYERDRIGLDGRSDVERYFLQPAIVKVFRIYRIESYSKKANFPDITLKDATWDFP